MGLQTGHQHGDRKLAQHHRLEDAVGVFRTGYPPAVELTSFSCVHRTRPDTSHARSQNKFKKIKVISSIFQTTIK